MVGRVHTGTALSARAVDAQFWALVCEDEEWLDAEFAGIVAEPAERQLRPRRKLGLWVEGARRVRRGPGNLPIVPGRAHSPVVVAGGGRGRQRSPPVMAVREGFRWAGRGFCDEGGRSNRRTNECARTGLSHSEMRAANQRRDADNPGRRGGTTASRVAGRGSRCSSCVRTSGAATATVAAPWRGCTVGSFRGRLAGKCELPPARPQASCGELSELLQTICTVRNTYERSG
jgi:hypothetical protein